MELKKCKEIKSSLISSADIEEGLKTGEIAYIKHDKAPILLGKAMLLKVNTNIGVSDPKQIEIELNKIKEISKLTYAPDSMMDHTYINLKKPLWKYMVDEIGKPIGTLPHYATFGSEKGIDKTKLLESIEEMAQYGVSFMTLHPTSTLKMLEVANKCRSVPTTSRGGVIVLKDAMINKRNENIFVDYFDDIINIFLKYNITMSIGTTFRPARIDEALDEVQLEEINQQKKFIEYVKSKGVQVIMEGVGHISLRDIPKYCELIKGNIVPLMPLGPMPTDATIGFDHVTAAIGATVIASCGNVGSINSVTREEHTGGVPSVNSIIEGLKSARVVAHCINLSRFQKYGEIDRIIADNRVQTKSCVINGGIFDDYHETNTNEGCSRCRYECPLTILN